MRVFACMRWAKCSEVCGQAAMEGCALMYNFCVYGLLLSSLCTLLGLVGVVGYAGARTQGAVLIQS